MSRVSACFLVALLICTARGDVTDFDNCEILGRDIKVAWTVNAAAGKVDFLMCGCLLPEMREAGSNQYMAIGLSGSADRVDMMEADTVVAWIDQQIIPHAEDYYLSNRYQCRGGDGVCSDAVYSNAECTDDVTEVGGYVEDAMQCVTFSRPINATDEVCDRAFDLENEQYIVWAVGGIEESAFKHFVRADFDEDPILWSRTPEQNCMGGLQCSACPGFVNEQMIAMENSTFIANIGPTGNERGYMAITGRAGWGIAWFLNGTLIPEVIVQRGRTYTFITEGGDNSVEAGQYHPFYITNSRSGGRLLNTEVQQAAEIVYAGFTEDNEPIGIGRYCEYRENVAARGLLSGCGSREQYTNSLDYYCEGEGGQGNFSWTPDETTPDAVFYQCATHRNLGWKITVVDSSEGTGVNVVAVAVSVSVVGFVLIVAVVAVVVLVSVVAIMAGKGKSYFPNKKRPQGVTNILSTDEEYAMGDEQ